MREVRSPRQLGQPAHPAHPPVERATNYRPVDSAGEMSADGVEEDATAAWLAHVQAGRIG